jgi:hypothetical protein
MQFAHSRSGVGFPRLDFAAGQCPATSGLAYQEDMAILLANDGSAYFHLLPVYRLSQK